MKLKIIKKDEIVLKKEQVDQYMAYTDKKYRCLSQKISELRSDRNFWLLYSLCAIVVFLLLARKAGKLQSRVWHLEDIIEALKDKLP